MTAPPDRAPAPGDLLAALYEDIRAARPGSTEFYELIRLAKRMVREGAPDGPDRVPDRPPR